MSRRPLTTQEFIKKARAVHKDKYDYSLVEYKHSHKKVKIICPEHGVFEQIPKNHLKGRGCFKCCIEKRKPSLEEFIEKASAVHKDKYDYSLVKYKNTMTKVKIICPDHGIFNQRPTDHLRGNGCPKCYIEKRKLSLEEFIEKARAIHGDRYDYSLVEYKHSHEKVKLICPEHGIFEQKPNSHLNGQGCPKCYIEKRKLSLEEFIEKARAIHGDRYDYSLVKYKHSKQKVKLICPEHGIFEQRPSNHLRGNGCPKCAGVKKSTAEEFVEKAKLVHGGKYDYSLVEYKNTMTKVKIICHGHGIFEQTPNSHLNGQGCPKCGVIVSKPEQEVADFISSLGYDIIQSYRGWCPEKAQLEIDIFIPSLNLGFEFNGLYWHSKRPKDYHKEKTLHALNNDIQLIHIWEEKWKNNPEQVRRMIEKRIKEKNI